MKTTYLFAITTLLVALVGCHRHNHEHGEDDEGSTVAKPMTQTPALATPAQAKTVELLPNEIKADDISGKNVEQDRSGKKVIYWEDPMVEGRHFSKSGKSPFMDMQLAPRYAE
jgi:Cu(I)/Ag(I) efflux system membrane fusion protein